MSGRPSSPDRSAAGRWAFESYVQAIFELAEDDLETVQARLAERLAVSRPSVSEAVHRMAAVGLVDLDGRNLRLTVAGEELACAVVRRHRLAERMLTDTLGLSWADAHSEAARWEHVISAAVEAALAQHLGNPTTCPHGNPIPGAGYVQPDTVVLAEVGIGERAIVERVPERLEVLDGVLERLERAGLIPGITVQVVARTDDGTVVVRTGRGDVEVPPEVARWLLVVPGDLAVISDQLRSPP